MLEILKKICSTLLQKAVPKRFKTRHSTFFHSHSIFELKVKKRRQKWRKRWEIFFQPHRFILCPFLCIWPWLVGGGISGVGGKLLDSGKYVDHQSQNLFLWILHFSGLYNYSIVKELNHSLLARCTLKPENSFLKHKNIL